MRSPCPLRAGIVDVFSRYLARPIDSESHGDAAA